jgi:hypothetical protein
MKKLLPISIILFCLLACTSKKPEDIIKKVLNKNPLAFVVDTIRKSDDKNIVVIYQGSDSNKLISLINEKEIIKTPKIKFADNTDISGLKILKDENDLTNIIVYFKTDNKDTTTDNYWNLNKNEVCTKYLLKTENKILFSDNILKGTQIAKLFNYEHILDSIDVPTEALILSNITKEYGKTDMDWSHSVNNFKLIGFTKKENTTEALVEFNLSGTFVGRFWYGSTPPQVHNKAYKVVEVFKKYGNNWVFVRSDEVN